MVVVCFHGFLKLSFYHCVCILIVTIHLLAARCNEPCYHYYYYYCINNR